MMNMISNSLPSGKQGLFCWSKYLEKYFNGGATVI